MVLSGVFVVFGCGNQHELLLAARAFKETRKAGPPTFRIPHRPHTIVTPENPGKTVENLTQQKKCRRTPEKKTTENP